MILPREFYERDTLTVARDLLGQVLVRQTEEGTASGVIVETEAYLGTQDDAAHSYRGKSERVRVQFGPAGCAYIYMIYGMYYCLNITTGPPGIPEVVLLRALEPLAGVGLMQKRRGDGEAFEPVQRAGQALPRAGHREGALRRRPVRPRPAVCRSGREHGGRRFV